MRLTTGYQNSVQLTLPSPTLLSFLFSSSHNRIPPKLPNSKKTKTKKLGHVGLLWLHINFAQREANPGSIFSHDARSASVKGQDGAYDGEGAARLINAHSGRRVAGQDELSQREEEEGQGEAAEDEQNGNVGLEGGDEEEAGEEAPGDEKDAEGEAVGVLVTGVGVLDAQRGYHEHGKGEPEGAVGAVDGGTKGVADAELHQAGNELGCAAKEDGETKDGLLRTNGTVQRVAVWESVSRDGFSSVSLVHL